MLGILSEQEIEDFLKSQIIGRIGSHYNNITYITPISYVYNNNIIIAHSAEGMKIDMMRGNPSVCFEVDKIENMGNWRSVITWGTFSEITDADERKNAVKKLYMRRFPAVVSEKVKLNKEWPFEPEDTELVSGIIFKIKLYKKTGRFERGDAITF